MGLEDFKNNLQILVGNQYTMIEITAFQNEYGELIKWWSGQGRRGLRRGSGKASSKSLQYCMDSERHDTITLENIEALC